MTSTREITTIARSLDITYQKAYHADTKKYERVKLYRIGKKSQFAEFEKQVCKIAPKRIKVRKLTSPCFSHIQSLEVRIYHD